MAKWGELRAFAPHLIEGGSVFLGSLELLDGPVEQVLEQVLPGRPGPG